MTLNLTHEQIKEYADDHSWKELIDRGRYDSARADVFVNTVTGYGGSYDKTTYGTFSISNALPPDQLTALYHCHDIPGRMIDLVANECLRKCYSVELENDPELSEEVEEELRELGTDAKFAEADAWGRLYGGAAVVIGTDDGMPADTALDPARVKKVLWLRPVDCRYLSPRSLYYEGPKRGEPDVYWYSEPLGSMPNVAEQPSAAAQAGISGAFPIHESRLIIFRGARTSYDERQKLNYWDYSVLQRPYETIRAFETAFKSVEVLITDGPQAVFETSNLQQYVGAGNRGALENRLRAVNLVRSVMRALIIEKDKEAFVRQPIQFTGLPDLLDKFMLRLAASVELPVTILMGQSPAGMNATGDSDFRWFYDTITTRQKNYVAPRLRRLVQIILASKGKLNGAAPERTDAYGDPVESDDTADATADAKPTEAKPAKDKARKVEIKFEPLWSPTASEAADIRTKNAQAASTLIQAEVITPDEAALSDHVTDDYEIDREAREERMKPAKAELAPVEGEDDELDPNAPPGPDGSTPPATMGPQGAEDVQKTALNGAQIASMLDIVKSVADGSLPRDSGIAMLTLAFPITSKEAEQIMGQAGTPEFEPTKPEPAFGGGFGGPPGDDNESQDPAKPGGQAPGSGGSKPPFGSKPGNAPPAAKASPPASAPPAKKNPFQK